MAEKITKSHPIGLERFWSVCVNIFEIWNLYAKYITFACSLPTLTSTWRSDYRNRPGGYMSGELKSENINMEKSPYSKKPSSSTDYCNHPINYNYIQRKILVKGPKLQFLYKI
jgi:hypothetical protein